MAFCRYVYVSIQLIAAILTIVSLFAGPSDAIHAHHLVRLLLVKGFVKRPIHIPIPLPLPIPVHKEQKKVHKKHIHKFHTHDLHHLDDHHDPWHGGHFGSMMESAMPKFGGFASKFASFGDSHHLQGLGKGFSAGGLDKGFHDGGFDDLHDDIGGDFGGSKGSFGDDAVLEDEGADFHGPSAGKFPGSGLDIGLVGKLGNRFHLEDDSHLGSDLGDDAHGPVGDLHDDSFHETGSFAKDDLHLGGHAGEKVFLSHSA